MIETTGPTSQEYLLSSPLRKKRLQSPSLGENLGRKERSVLLDLSNMPKQLHSRKWESYHTVVFMAQVPSTKLSRSGRGTYP